MSNLIQRFEVTLKGLTPLIHHKDNIRWGEKVKTWQNDPANKKITVPGDDRSPAFTWIGYLYHWNDTACIEADNLMTMLREGGKQCIQSGRTTFMRATQSGIVVDRAQWPLYNPTTGKAYDVKGIRELAKNESDYEKHFEWCEERGFELFEKRAKIGQAKHVRIRPLFRDWAVTGTITVSDKTLTEKVLVTILSNAGLYVGLCDWRPGAPKAPGSYGRFEVELKRIS